MTGDIPVFETERLILRGVTEADVPSYTRHFVDYEVLRHLGDAIPWPYPENGVLTFLRNDIFPRQGKDRWLWGIFLKENADELIGAVDLWREERPENRGLWLGRKFWKRGIMTEAADAVMDYAFGPLGFERLVLSNAIGNERSRRLKEKTGARFLRETSGKFIDPVYKGTELWELTRESWLRGRKSAESRSA